MWFFKRQKAIVNKAGKKYFSTKSVDNYVNNSKISYVLRVIFFVPLFFTNIVFSLDFGVVANTFSIIEQDFEQMIKAKLARISDDEWKQHKLNIQTRVSKHVARPTPIKIGQTTTPRKFIYDPSIILRHDITDANGKVLQTKGTKANPLDYISITKPLLFLDGDNPKHIVWAKAQSGLWVLTNGSPIELEKKIRQPVYFDQYGKLSQKFEIKQIPAKVFQHGEKLIIEEVLP